MKIAIPVLDFSKSGGARVLSELANAWIRQGHEVHFLVAKSDSCPHFPTVAPIVRASGPGSRGGLLARVLALRRLIRDAAPSVDVLLANFHLTAWATWLAGRQARARAFYYSQAYEVEFYMEHDSRWRGALLSRLARYSYRLLPRLIVNGPMYMSPPGAKAIAWVPPGVDSDCFYPRESAWPGHPEPVVLGCIGRQEHWKGTSDVFAAAGLLQQRGVDFVLRSAFHAPAGFEALVGRVEVPKPANDKELAAFYRSCDIVIAPGTLQLGAPHYPVMEAMACGVPVITTGYMPADEGNALIVPVGRPDAIADAVVNALADPAATMGRVERGREAMKAFSWSAISDRMLKLFQLPAQL